VQNFTNQCKNNGIQPPKLNILQKFYQISEYKHPARAYPLIVRYSRNLQDLYPVSGRVRCCNQDGVAEGVTELWGSNFSGTGSHEFSAPPSGKTVRRTPVSFQGARTCSRSSITVPSLVGLGFHPPPGWPKTLSFCSLFVCVPITLFMDGVSAYDFVIFDTVK